MGQKHLISRKEWLKWFKFCVHLNENLFSCEPKVRFTLVVRKFCGSSFVFAAGLVDS
jgi:hypothetical protein